MQNGKQLIFTLLGLTAVYFIFTTSTGKIVSTAATRQNDIATIGIKCEMEANKTSHSSEEQRMKADECFRKEYAKSKQ